MRIVFDVTHSIPAALGAAGVDQAMQVEPPTPRTFLVLRIL